MASEGRSSSILRRLGDRPDETALRWIFRALIISTLAFAAIDYVALDAALVQRGALPHETLSPEPLPSVRQEPESSPIPSLRISDVKMREAMSFELSANGRLLATGTINIGSAKAFAAEIEKRGTYVKTVVLHSPGGSVQDALRMGGLIRERRFATEVTGGTYCASSCPLVFAGGVNRLAGKDSVIGVHQISAFDNAASSMADAQQVSALCQKYLRDMGVDLSVWVHAMETPKERLYYFKPQELIALKLATTADGARPLGAKD